MKVIRSRLGLCISAVLILSLVLLFGGRAQDDSDEVTTPQFTVTLSNSVDIEFIVSDPGDITIQRAADDLKQRYHEFPTDIQIRIWAVTDYQISVWTTYADVDTTAPGGAVEDDIPDGMLQIEPATFTPAVGDDVAGQPSNNITDWTDLPCDANNTGNVSCTATDDLNLFTGVNTYGGTLEYQDATMTLRIDLDNFGDNDAGNVYTFQVTFTVTETT